MRTAVQLSASNIMEKKTYGVPTFSLYFLPAMHSGAIQ